MALSSALFGRAPVGGRIVARPLVPALGSTPVRALVSRRSEIGAECTSNVAERMIETNGVELCTEGFGDPADPPLLLIMGMSGSMLWWEERFCRMLADGGRFVIRYDHRDTGRSVTYEPGRPGYQARTWSATPPGCSTPIASRPRTWSASRWAGRLRSCSRSTRRSRPVAGPHQPVFRGAA